MVLPNLETKFRGFRWNNWNNLNKFAKLTTFEYVLMADTKSIQCFSKEEVLANHKEWNSPYTWESQLVAWLA